MLSHVITWLCLSVCILHTVVLPQKIASYPGQPLPVQQVARVSSSPPPCLTGIVNSYTPVIGFGCDSSTLHTGPHTGFASGDKVLLIQMQVPQVNLSNTAAFGTLLNTTCIGNYEFNRIQSINGNTVQLSFALLRDYDVSGKVQLIRVPEYDSASVCGITCLPWDGTVGGVLAIDVKTQLTLEGNIDVSGKGFRGGMVDNNILDWFFGEQQYYYPPVSTLAAQKGEGIVFIPVDQSFGRGCAGNGGGGGNAHNGGGGGGGNAGAGGDGGLEITNLPAAPSPNTNGIGGSKYFDSDFNKVIMGGGAGAGHANDGRGSSGGSGGGIVFITANTLQANNFRVVANGVDVFGGQDQKDGQGGGGGGGTVVLNVGQINGVLPCALKGGRGGSNPYTPDFQLHGPGGGGGGGKLLMTQNLPAVMPSIQGGFNGLSSQGLTNGALPGENGKILTGFSIPESHTPAHPVSDHMVIAAQPPGCFGVSNGQIGVYGSTAIAFSLNNGPWQSDSLFTNLPPGNYQIALQFSGGCMLDTVAVLTAPPPVVDSLVSIADAACTTGGSISVAAISGTAPFEYQISGSTWQPTGQFTGLTPGTYTIALRDANGCTISSDYSIQPPVAADDSLLSISPASCISGGAVEVVPVTGIAPFEFQVNGGGWQSSGIFTGLAPGNYEVTMADAAGCTDSGIYTIQAPPVLQDSVVAVTNATCLSGGMISMSAVSGSGPFEFQINNNGWQPTGLFTGLSPDVYAVTIRDAAGCTTTSTLNIDPPIPLRDSLVSIIQATCLHGGALVLVPYSGSAPFEYQINSGSWQPSGDFMGLTPGNYTVQLRDGAGCVVTNNYFIEAPPPAIDSLTAHTDATCVQHGMLQITATSGTAPFEYSLNGGQWQPDGTFNNLPAGVYSILLQDAAGCTDSGNYTILASPAAIDTLLSLSPATCMAGGALQVEAIQGTPPFEFRINGGNWQPSGFFSGLSPGTYVLTTTDAAGCTDAGSYLIDPPPPLQDSILFLQQATCVHGGELDFQAVSGTPPFEYQLNNSGWQFSGDFHDLTPGVYLTSIRDAAGCVDSASITIETSPPARDSLLDLAHATCLHGGLIDLLPVSGTPPFEFQLNGSVFQPSGSFPNLIPGIYSVVLQDAAGCTQVSMYEIKSPPPVTDTLIALEEMGCHQLGSIIVNGLGGTMPFQFQLDNQPWQMTGDFSNLQSGTYGVTIRDDAGCTHQSFYSIKPYQPLALQLDSLGAVDCKNAFGYLAASATGGSGGYTYQLDNFQPLQTNGLFTPLGAGNYNLVVTDSAGCSVEQSHIVVPNLIDSVATSETVTIYEGSLYELPDGSFTGQPGIYDYHYKNVSGCDSLHVITLLVLKRHVYIPNIFSPDENGENDFFTVFSDASLESVESMKVFDRWGELVFKKENFSPNLEQNGWDGLFRGRPVNPGVFVWLIRLKFTDGLEWILSGDVTVVR